ncbi:MAG: GerMN domain-containing protein [Ilumatobacteraceae bacterium]
MTRRRRPVLIAPVIGLVVAASACGLQPDAAPRDLPGDEQAISLSGSGSGSDATGADRIFLVAPGEDRLLRSVPREASTRKELVEILLRGPNDDELEAQYSSFIPVGTELLSERSQGQILTIDLAGGITELSGANLARAIAQIVYTVSELEGVEAVKIRVQDEDLAWPKANGETTADPLRTYDYPNFVVTAQPEFPAVPALS